jgi:hypothetical protein
MHGGKGAGGLWHPIVLENYRNRADQAAWAGYLVVMLLATLTFWWTIERSASRYRQSSERRAE